MVTSRSINLRERITNLANFLVTVSRNDCRWIFAIEKTFGVLNGDPYRAAIAKAVATRTTCQTAIETGTYFGETSRWLAQHYRRVITIESNPGFANFAKFRIENHANIELVIGDSSAKFHDALKTITGPFFAYLDAHWDRLPLGAELTAIEGRSDYVCMIDDFEIEGTTFGFDEYNGTRIGVPLLQRFVPSITHIFVPDYPPEMSGPQRRGYCVFGAGEPIRLLETDYSALRMRPFHLKPTPMQEATPSM
jgi:hypothetical protein